MLYVVETRDCGRWRQVRHTEPMSRDEAQSLIDNLARWNLGLFRAYPHNPGGEQ